MGGRCAVVYYLCLYKFNFQVWVNKIVNIKWGHRAEKTEIVQRACAQDLHFHFSARVDQLWKCS